MKALKFAIIPAFIFSLLLVSCSEDSLINGAEAPSPAAAVSGCSVTGGNTDWNTWSTDINTVLDNCYLEDAASSCSGTEVSVVKEYHFGYGHLGGVNITPGSFYSAATINAHIGIVAQAALDGRPAGGIENLRRCDYYIADYNYQLNPYLSNQTFNYWVFTCKVTYKKYCCPLPKNDDEERQERRP